MQLRAAGHDLPHAANSLVLMKVHTFAGLNWTTLLYCGVLLVVSRGSRFCDEDSMVLCCSGKEWGRGLPGVKLRNCTLLFLSGRKEGCCFSVVGLDGWRERRAWFQAGHLSPEGFFSPPLSLTLSFQAFEWSQWPANLDWSGPVCGKILQAKSWEHSHANFVL